MVAGTYRPQRCGVWDREDGFLLTGSDALITTNAPIEATITERLPGLATRLHRAPLVANIDVAPADRSEARNEVRSRYGWPLKATVAMTGYVPEEEVSRLLSGADVGVLPFNHGVTLKSGTLLTLFAHGLPVVATRSDPPEPELADGRLVRLVERRDISGLAAALSGLLTDASQRARLAEAGHAYCRRLSWSAIAERHLEVYEAVLNKAARSQ